MIKPCVSCGWDFEDRGLYEHCDHCNRDTPPSIDLKAFRSLFGCHGYAPSHGGGPDGPGWGLLYYAIVHALRSDLNVCIGSGDGEVPALMRQAQIDSGVVGGRTVLIDKDKEAFPGNGRPFHRDDLEHPFNHFYPEIERIWEDSGDAWRRFEPGSIGVVHIDGNHTFHGAYNDFAFWEDRVRPDGLLTMHDTCNALVPGNGVAMALRTIAKRYTEWQILDIPTAGTGLALLRRRG